MPARVGGVSRPTVYALVNRGELVKVKHRPAQFLTGESLTAYVDRLTEAATNGGLPVRIPRFRREYRNNSADSLIIGL
jgi:hypothetical protein